MKEKVVVQLDEWVTGEEGMGESYVQESQSGGVFVPVGSCPVFHTESGYLGGILMAGFVSTSLCLDHWILGIRDVKALLQ